MRAKCPKQGALRSQMASEYLLRPGRPLLHTGMSADFGKEGGSEAGLHDAAKTSSVSNVKATNPEMYFAEQEIAIQERANCGLSYSPSAIGTSKLFRNELNFRLFLIDELNSPAAQPLRSSVAHIPRQLFVCPGLLLVLYDPRLALGREERIAVRVGRRLLLHALGLRSRTPIIVLGGS